MYVLGRIHEIKHCYNNCTISKCTDVVLYYCVMKLYTISVLLFSNNGTYYWWDYQHLINSFDCAKMNQFNQFCNSCTAENIAINVVQNFSSVDGKCEK